MPRHHHFPFLLLLPLLALTPGCVVGEIRDSINRTNDSLSVVEQQLNELRATNQKLDRLQVQLDQLDHRLAGVDTRLQTVDTKLATLDPIGTSLRDIDAHLASLRVTIQKISDTIPFIDIADDAATTQPAAGNPADPSHPTTRPRLRIRPATQSAPTPQNP